MTLKIYDIMKLYVEDISSRTKVFQDVEWGAELHYCNGKILDENGDDLTLNYWSKGLLEVEFKEVVK